MTQVEEQLVEARLNARQRTARRVEGPDVRRGALVAVLAIAVGLALAPAAFQMFSRAPKGGDMINEFRPFMTSARIGNFVGFLEVINAAESEARTRLRPSVASAATDPADRAALAAVDDWSAKWRGGDRELGIHPDMTQMLRTMTANLDNFAAVDALPPFPLFPWFFVLPGVAIAGLAWSVLRRARTAKSDGWRRPALIVFGLGLVAAPFVFQMAGGENRAFQGNGMIDDFKPIMTEQKVTTVQRYFPTIGLAEGQLRLRLLPLARQQPDAGSYPAITTLSRDWPRISGELAAFLGAMSDNVDNFAAVKALPPFALFPVFFIVPGLLVAGLAWEAGRPKRPRRLKGAGAVAVTLLLVGAGCSTGDDDTSGAATAKGSVGDPLVGLFRIDPGQCSTAGVTGGTYFRMIQPGGKPGEGPFVANGDSPCGDKTFSPMQPGSDGGLWTGRFQAQAAAPFDQQGNGATGIITKPTGFFAVHYANATNEVDPQTGAKTRVPEITVADRKLSGDLSAFAAAWNGQHFNQGAPKPDGARPGLTAGPTGTYDAATKHYVLEWSSQIVGGPFNNFTGVWHLEGVFEAR